MLDKTDNDIRLEDRKRNAGRIFLISAGITILIGIYYSYLLIQKNTPITYGESNFQAFMIAFASILSYWLLKQKQLLLSVLLFLGAFSIAIVVTALHYGGMDLILSLILLLTYLGVAGATLPRKVFEPLITFSVFLSVFIGFIGYWDPLERAYSAPDVIAYLFALVLIIVYGFILSRQYKRYSLRTKLVVFFTIIVSISIAIVFAFANFNMERVLFESSRQRLLSQVESAAADIDAFLRYGEDSIEIASTQIDMQTYLLLEPSDREGTTVERQVQNLLYALENKSPDIISYGLLDTKGIVVLDTRIENIGNDESAYLHFTQTFSTFSNFKSYISPVLYLPDEVEGVFFISTPVYSDSGLNLGVLRAKYKASVFQELIYAKSEEHQEAFATNASYALFDETDVLLAYQAEPEFIGKVPFTPTPQEFEHLRAQQLIPLNENVETISFNFPGLSNAIDQMNVSPFFEAENLDSNVIFTGAIMDLERAPWKIVALEAQSDFAKPVRDQAQAFFFLAVVTVFFAFIASAGLTNLITAPILRLRTVAQRFMEGDLTARASVEAEDEIGSLAETFNALVARLNKTVISLEDRVNERTTSLELRSRYLEGAAEIGRLATSIIDTDELSRTVVELIRERFDLYYVGLFIADENEEWAVLRAGTGVAGEIMLSNNHRLKIGEGMIGWTIRYAEARIALDVGEDAVRFSNPVLPETRSEGALPLRSRGRVLGAISVQSTQPAAFDLEILRTLQTMADQIAVAFDNAALFQKSEEAFEAERRAYGELALQSWHDMEKRSSVSAFRVDSQGQIKKLDESTIELRHQVIGERQALREDGRVILLPIKSRGYVIGGIRIAKSQKGEKWTKDQLQLLSTLSEQLSVALESARLFEETQMRAQREAIISDISSKVGASIRMDTILKTTVQELGKALSGADISFEITGIEKGQSL